MNVIIRRPALGGNWPAFYWPSIVACAALVALCAAPENAAAQTVHLPTQPVSQVQPQPFQPMVPANQVPSLSGPPPASPWPGGTPSPHATLGQSVQPAYLDPYAAVGAGGQPVAPGSYPMQPVPPAGAYPPANPYGAQPYYGTGAPYPGQVPTSMFPNTTTQGMQQQVTEYVRLFQNLRLQHTWVSGSPSEDNFDWNESEISVTAAFPGLFHTQSPLLVTPGFILVLWAGPDAPPPPPDPDLPANAYTAYLNLGWAPRFSERFSGEFNFRPAVSTAFNTFNTDSLIFPASGVGVFQFSPELAIKLGAAWLDRPTIKLLPVAGVVWTPNAMTRFEAVFPKPKLSQYLTTWGNTDIWWYLSGEYGGGTWTIERDSGADQRIDITDWRAGGGLEWTHYNMATGFVEVACVFSRKVTYVGAPEDNFNPPTTFMLRGGYAF